MKQTCQMSGKYVKMGDAEAPDMSDERKKGKYNWNLKGSLKETTVTNSF